MWNGHLVKLQTSSHSSSIRIFCITGPTLRRHINSSTSNDDSSRKTYIFLSLPHILLRQIAANWTLLYTPSTFLRPHSKCPFLFIPDVLFYWSVYKAKRVQIHSQFTTGHRIINKTMFNSLPLVIVILQVQSGEYVKFGFFESVEVLLRTMETANFGCSWILFFFFFQWKENPKLAGLYIHFAHTTSRDQPE